MAMKYATGKHLLGELADALKLDRGVTRIVLSVDMDQVIEAEVKFYVAREHLDGIKAALAKVRPLDEVKLSGVDSA